MRDGRWRRSSSASIQPLHLRKLTGAWRGDSADSLGYWNTKETAARASGAASITAALGDSPWSEFVRGDELASSRWTGDTTEDFVSLYDSSKGTRSPDGILAIEEANVCCAMQP